VNTQGSDRSGFPAPPRAESAVPGDLGDPEIIALFRGHWRRLTGYLISLGADRATADDIVQDSFLATRRRWPEVRGFAGPVVYPYRIATYRLRRVLRTRQAAGHSGGCGHPVAADGGVQLAPEFEATLSKLPRRQREVMLLNLIYGFKISEIAVILQVHVGTVKHYLSLGRQRLAELLLTVDFDASREQRSVITDGGPLDGLAALAGAGEQGLRRLRGGLRRLHDDAREAERIDDIADLTDAASDAYHLGEAAERHGDLDGAERHFRRAAGYDHDDAAQRLALILDAQADLLQTAEGGEHTARAKRAQALVWHGYAGKLGVPGLPPRDPVPEPRHGPSWLVPGHALHCTIVCVDIAAFGDPQRDDDVQLHLRESLYAILEESFRACPIAWHGCYREDRGDGVLVVAPPAIATGALADPLVAHLRAGLRRHNKHASDTAQIRLRMALHAGPVHRDGNGVAGQALTLAFRLLEAPAFKEEFAVSSAALGVIVSGQIYDTVIRPGHGLADPAGYHPIEVALKETRTTAWLDLPAGLPSHTRPDICGADAHQLRGPRRPPAGSPGTGDGRPAAPPSRPFAGHDPGSPAPSPPAVRETGPGAAARPPVAGQEPRRPPQARGGPTALRILLGAQFRRLREAQGMTQGEAGRLAGTSHARMKCLELGLAEFKDRDITVLLALYEVRDAPVCEALRGLAEQANTPDRPDGHPCTLPGFLEPWAGLEQAATLIRAYQAQFVPALLQTEAYAHAAIRLQHPGYSDDDIGRCVRMRMIRQKVLTQPRRPLLWVVTDEAALWHPVGGADVIRAQLRHLIEAASWPSVRIQVRPVHVSSHPAAAAGFSILRFREFVLPDIVCAEQAASVLYMERPAEVDNYMPVMDQICVAARPVDATPSILRTVLKDL